VGVVTGQNPRCRRIKHSRSWSLFPSVLSVLSVLSFL
jgi:hypothetical protein